MRDGVEDVLDRFAQLETLPYVSVITVVELYGGVAHDRDPTGPRGRALRRIIDNSDLLGFGLREAQAYGEIVAELGFARGLIIDRMIAAQALVAGAALVTLNARDFRTIAGLQYEDWAA